MTAVFGALGGATLWDGDLAGTLHEAVEAIGKSAERALGERTPTARRRREVARGVRILSNIIRRGVEAGTFRPPCTRWALERLPYAIVAGMYARSVFDLQAERSLGARAATEAALELLCPRGEAHV